MNSHLLMLLLASAAISVVIGFITKPEGKRKKFILLMFGIMVLFVIISAWLMYWIH